MPFVFLLLSHALGRVQNKYVGRKAAGGRRPSSGEQIQGKGAQNTCVCVCAISRCVRVCTNNGALSPLPPTPRGVGNAREGGQAAAEEEETEDLYPRSWYGRREEQTQKKSPPN